MEKKIVINKKDLLEIIKNDKYVTVLYILSNNPNTKYSELDLQDFEYKCYGMTLIECHYDKMFKKTSKNHTQFPYFELYIDGKKIKNQYKRKELDWIEDYYYERLNLNNRF